MLNEERYKYPGYMPATRSLRKAKKAISFPYAERKRNIGITYSGRIQKQKSNSEKGQHFTVNSKGYLNIYF